MAHEKLIAELEHEADNAGYADLWDKEKRFRNAATALRELTSENVQLSETNARMHVDLVATKAQLAAANELTNWLFNGNIPDGWLCGKDAKHYFLHYGNDEFARGTSALSAIEVLKAALAKGEA